MNARQLSAETVIERLRKMADLLLDQLDRLRSAGIDSSDFGVQLQIERILSALVDLAAAINTHVAVVELGAAPYDMASSFARARQLGLITSELAEAIAPSVGLRNIVVHATWNWTSTG